MEGNMPWYRVKIPNNDVAGVSATALVAKSAQAYRAAGLPVSARVYHCRSAGGDHIYYFSPEAAAMEEGLLQQFGGTVCHGEPGLAGCSQVIL
jgi:hypothetical protein